MLQQKISNDFKKKYDLDPDFHWYLCKLKEKYCDDKKLKGKHVDSFIHGYVIYPLFSVTLVMEAQVLELLSMSRKDFLCLHIDATGSIFSQPPHSNTKVFYHSVVLPADEWQPTLAVMELITCSHTVRNICSSLNIFIEKLKKYSLKWPIISIVESDFSKAMLQTCCKSFNNVDLQIYLNQTYVECEDPLIEAQPRTLIHVCSSHVIKAAIRRIKLFTTDETLQKYFRSTVVLLIHSTSLQHAKYLFGIFIALFAHTKQCMEHEVYIKKLSDVQPLDLQDIEIDANLLKDSVLDDFTFNRTQR